MDKIYTITMVDDRGGYISRCVGWYKKYKDAKKSVEKNLGKNNGIVYKYAVIEEFECGIYPCCKSKNQKWFEAKLEFDNDDYLVGCNYEEIEKAPEQFDHTVNFSMG